MAVLEIVRLGDPVLRTPADPVEPAQITTAKFQQFCDDLVETVVDAGGLGLAAPQVGAPLQAFVYDANGSTQPEPRWQIVVNPMVDPHPGELEYDWEGCLSIPDLRGLVPRHASLRLRGLDRDGRPLDLVVEDFAARIVQHEFDHLHGVVFLDRMRDLQSLAFEEEWECFVLAEDSDEQSTVG